MLRTLGGRFQALLALVAASILGGFLAASVSADDLPPQPVDVVDDAYEPASVAVEVGQPVRWTWTGGNRHSVTALGGDFDSHPACATNPAACGERGTIFQFVPTEPGQLFYRCYLHSPLMAGVIDVVPAAEPAPDPADPPAPDPAPEPDPPVPPDLSQEPDPTPQPSPERSPEPEPSPSAPAPPPGGSVVGPPPAQGEDVPPVQSESENPAPGDPADDLEPFPSPSPLVTRDEPDADEVAVPVPDGAPPASRTALLAVATLALLGTAGAFSALVLFGPPWEP